MTERWLAFSKTGVSNRKNLELLGRHVSIQAFKDNVKTEANAALMVVQSELKHQLNARASAEAYLMG
jgi:hypothetical protein